ncbi:hypothetical protein CRE_31531 [Caenorhabditis remanei]|uniref:Retrotransposon gag domain-containing protein n=1 Tax=Caenorhabditis remanei TaxID=31234 RepID=E3NGH4_CAERE|nr:hypothetical protein CRE_31531 [Caenorhabditis remanei]
MQRKQVDYTTGAGGLDNWRRWTKEGRGDHNHAPNPTRARRRPIHSTIHSVTRHTNFALLPPTKLQSPTSKPRAPTSLLGYCIPVGTSVPCFGTSCRAKGTTSDHQTTTPKIGPFKRFNWRKPTGSSDRVLRSHSKVVQGRTSSPLPGHYPPPFNFEDDLNESKPEFTPNQTVLFTEETRRELQDKRERFQKTPTPENGEENLLRESPPNDTLFRTAIFNPQIGEKLGNGENLGDRTLTPGQIPKLQPESSEFTPDQTLLFNAETRREMANRRVPTWKEQGEMTKILDRRISKFNDGKSSELKEWLDQFSRALHRCHIAPEEAVELIPLYLSGPALLKYNRLDEKKIQSWEEAAKMLIEAHDCPAEKEVALQELTTISQGKKSLSAFGQQIRTLGNYAYDALNSESKEQLMATHFLTGTSKKIRTRLRRLQTIPKTLSGMQSEAEKIQRLLQIEEEEEEEDNLIAAVERLNLQQPQRNDRRENEKGNTSGNPQWNQNPNNQENPGNNWNQNCQCQCNPQNGGGNQNPNNQGNWSQNRNSNQGNSGRTQNSNQGRQLRWDQNTGRPYVNNIGHFLMGIATILTLIMAPTTEANPQICGFGEAGNVFIPPRPILCTFKQDIALKDHKVNVYTLRHEAIQMEAIKCFKHEVLAASISKKYNDLEMKEISPGIFRTEATQDIASNHTLWLGTSVFTTYEFTLEVGQIATIDGQHAISNLGDLESCNFSTGNCQDDSSTIIWQAVDTRKECQYEFLQSATALISQQQIAIEEMGIFSNIDGDLRRLQSAAEGCFVHQPYLTDDGYLVEFYEAPLTGWVPDMHVESSPERRRPRLWNRGPREVGSIGGHGGMEFQFELGENYSTPILKKLFGTNNWTEIPELKNPISEPALLREISRYNISNTLLQNRARFYAADRNARNPLLLMTLKAIRIGQYGARQLKELNEMVHPLTKGEEQFKTLLERQDAHVFNKLLEREFGISNPDWTQSDNNFDPPKILPESLAIYQEGLQPLLQEQLPPPPLSFRQQRLQSNGSPQVRSRPTKGTSTTTTTSPTKPSPSTKAKALETSPRPTVQTTKEKPQIQLEDRDPIPEENVNVVYEQPDIPQHKPHNEMQVLLEKPKEQIFREVCQEQWRTTSMFETVLQIDPTAAIRQLLRRSDISAKRIGETLLISKCQTVSPDRIHWDRKVNTTCFDLIPVTVKDKVWFFLPGSQDLVAEAMEIPCEERPPSVRWEHNRWVGLKNQEVQPQHLTRPNKREQQHFILKAPDTFYTILGEENGVSTGADKEQSRRLGKRLVTEGILKETIEKISNSTAAAGRSARKMYESAMGKLRDGLQMAVFEILVLILWIAIPLLTIVLILGVLYVYIKYKTIKRTRKLGRQTMRQARNALVEYAHNQIARVNNVELERSTRRPLRSYREEYTTFSVNSVKVKAVNAARLPHIDVELDGETLEALVDTGAAISYLPLSSVKSKINNRNTPSARAANGSSIHFLGTCKGTIKIGNFSIPHEWLVSKNSECPAPMLIGSDLIKKLNSLGHGLNINLHKNTIKIGESDIKINAITGGEKKIYLISPFEKRKEVEIQIQEILKQRIEQRSDSPFGTPIVLVRKTDNQKARAQKVHNRNKSILSFGASGRSSVKEGGCDAPRTSGQEEECHAL